MPEKISELEQAVTLLERFLDDEMRLNAYPAKRKMKINALIYLASKFEAGRVYSEKEVGELLCRWHTFSDPATLRRELYNLRFIDRDPYGREYHLEEVQPTREELEKRYS